MKSFAKKQSFLLQLERLWRSGVVQCGGDLGCIMACKNTAGLVLFCFSDGQTIDTKILGSWGMHLGGL